MRYITTYKIFESGIKPHEIIPKDYIRLDSIGSILNPENGVYYPALRNGGYDVTNPNDITSTEYDDIINTHLSDGDKEIVLPLIKSTEDFKDRIDFSLIDNIQDILIGFTDNTGRLSVSVEMGSIEVYNMRVLRGNRTESYENLFPVYYNLAKRPSIIYTISVSSNRLRSAPGGIPLPYGYRVPPINDDVLSITELIIFLRNKGWVVDNIFTTNIDPIPIPDTKIVSRITGEIIPREDVIEKSIESHMGDIKSGFILILKDKK